MVSFIPVDPADIPDSREGRRGRVSYPLLKTFMEQNLKCAKIDLTGLNRRPDYLRAVLYSYIRNHRLPIRIFSAKGDLYMMRLDLKNDGSTDPQWDPSTLDGETATEGAGGHLRNAEAVPITADEVTRRFGQEKNQITK